MDSWPRVRSGPSLGVAELELLPALGTVVRAGNGVDNIYVDGLVSVARAGRKTTARSNRNAHG